MTDTDSRLDSGFVQPVIVRPATHFDTIAAAALASGLALAQADLSADPWHTWLSSSFTKSVRRLKRPVELDHMRAIELPRTEIAVGTALGIAFPPMRYADFPTKINKLQVSGLELFREPGEGFTRNAAITPRIEVNADAAMTTGKTAAQVAHALGAWLLAQSLADRSSWALNPGLVLREHSFSGPRSKVDEEDPAVLVIRDNGLTEVTPGTATARVYLTPLG